MKQMPIQKKPKKELKTKNSEEAMIQRAITCFKLKIPFRVPTTITPDARR